MAAGPAADTEVSLNLGEESKKGVDKSEAIDMTERDPTRISSHLKLAFEDIFAEPHSAVHSFDGVWTTSFTVFRNTRTWCYRVTTLLCAVPATLFWGVYFAMLACCGVWCCRPCIKAFEIKMLIAKGFLSPALDAFIKPCFEALGFCFYNFRMFLHKSGGGEFAQTV